MTISTKRLPKYIHSVTYPIDVLEMNSRRIACILHTREELLSLIELGCIVGIGTRTRLRRLQLNEPVRSLRDAVSPFRNARHIPVIHPRELYAPSPRRHFYWRKSVHRRIDPQPAAS